MENTDWADSLTADSTAGERWSKLRLHEGILNYDLVYSENNYHKVTVKENSVEDEYTLSGVLISDLQVPFYGSSVFSDQA